MLWANTVKLRGSCERCGKREDLQAHHIVSRAHTGTRWDFDNGMCLCRRCHLFFMHRDNLGAADFLQERVGSKRLESLRVRSSKPTKFSTAELNLMANNFDFETRIIKIFREKEQPCQQQ
jgi:hypothetical protein